MLITLFFESKDLDHTNFLIDNIKVILNKCGISQSSVSIEEYWKIENMFKVFIESNSTFDTKDTFDKFLNEIAFKWESFPINI